MLGGGAKEAISQDDSGSLNSVLQSAARASKHILSTSLAASTDILLSRRDAALAGSSVLQGPARELLPPFIGDLFRGGSVSELLRRIPPLGSVSSYKESNWFRPGQVP